MDTCRSLIAVATLLIVVSSIETAKVIDCAHGKEGAAIVKSITVRDCDLENDAACNFQKGHNASIEIDFVSTESFSKATVDIHGIVGKFPLPFPLKPNDACGNYGFNCPVKENQEETLKLTIPIKKAYPKISATCQFKLWDEQKRLILCLEVPIKIIN